ncbi:MAG: hypothetical protein H6667_15430 [Ardenticatenaceae bacterium]|nr:hypothetical protein [Ardenticatenaceae bacterium]
MNSSSLPVWDDRWEAYQDILANLIDDLPAPTFKALAACLQAFGDSQFQFFRDGFRDGNLWLSAQYPAEYVLRTTLDQVGYDVSVIDQAAQQRRDGTKKMQETLHKADQLAQLALNLAVDNGLLKESTVITYFNKSAYVRTIPYAPLALVAVPYTAAAVPHDYLATPHEIGHHIYRHSPGLAAQLRATLPIQPNWLHNWREEIFADVYGCLIAGPVIGLDFQDILFDNDLENFMSDDGEHPVEAIRPFAYVKVLAKLGFHNAAKVLKKKWKRKLAARNNPESFVPFGEFGAVSLKEAQTKLEAFALQILAYLQDERGIQPQTFWSQDLAEGETLNSLYKKFAIWVDHLPNVTVPELKEEGDEVGVVNENGELVNKRRKGETKTWIDELKNPGRYPLPSSGWVTALASEGWNVSGPEEDPDKP